MTVTITEILPKNPSSYPEYDKLWEDDLLSVVVVFGKLDDGDNLEDDYNWGNADEFVSWLKAAKFKEGTGATLGKRYERTVGTKKEVVDVFYPGLFDSVADYAHLSNWKKAVNEHEVVIYLGHSVLGTGTAYTDISYPDFFQIFVVGGCLGYEYYVKPILDGKGDWSKVDVLSSIVENYYTEMTPLAGTFLAKLFYGFEHSGRASWQVILGAINKKLGHSHFGASGARGNCFSPYGNKC
jgi:hypothetical protein